MENQLLFCTTGAKDLCTVFISFKNEKEKVTNSNNYS
jgi:hypothetical protein